MVDACATYGIKAVLRPVRRFLPMRAACEAQFRNAFLHGCVGAWTLHPSQIDIAKRVFSLDPEEVAFAKRIVEAMPDGTGRRHDRRQDAGRRHLEAGQGHPRPGQAGGRRKTPSARPSTACEAAATPPLMLPATACAGTEVPHCQLGARPVIDR